MFKAEQFSCLEKIFASEGGKYPCERGCMFENERYSFQAAFYSRWILKRGCRVRIDSGLKDRISVRIVDYAGGTYNLPAGHDCGYLLQAGSVTCYPDILKPFTPSGLSLRPGLWTCVWITVDGGAAGEHKIGVALEDENGQELCRCEHTLKIVGVRLPECDIPVTQWIHADCICAYHRVQPFTDEFYGIFGKYLDTYVRHSGNMLYTPLYTPPLNTPPGEERMTVQTVDVSKTEGGYAFGFGKLERYIDFAQARGIRYFELSHLATQWGAEFCPKIVAREGGEERRIFGWDTPSSGAEYQTFLSGFLPALDKFLRGKGIADKCFVHLSDEPRREHYPAYAALSEQVRRYLPGYPIVDAMSEAEFCRSGAADIPAVALSGYEEFIRRASPVKKWVYYCMGETFGYFSNRFFDMPLQRLRVLGIQLWLNGCCGFLHWGFNFYFDYNSRFLLDPYHRTDAGGAYPSGDSFIVYPDYPSPQGDVVDSVRLEVFDEAIADYRCLKLLEQKRGREFVRRLLGRNGYDGFSVYPTDGEAFLRFREEIVALTEESAENE